MKKNTTLVRESKTSVKLTEHQQNLLKRINDLAVSLMAEFEDRNQAIKALTMDDSSLMQLLCSILMEQRTHESDYAVRAVRRRRENLEDFYMSPEELGGVLKINDVADILGISRQSVKVRVNNNQLIAFKQNEDFIFPAFQFTDSGLLNGFEEVMAAFDKDTHPMLRLGVLKAPISLGQGVVKNPIQIMQDGAKPNEMMLAIRAANQFGSHIAS